MIRNMFLTFVVTGLWHGAAWHFLAFGLFHGGGLSIERIFRSPGTDAPARPGRWALRPIQWLLTFAFVVVGFLLFRAPTVSDAWDMMKHFFSGAESTGAFQWLKFALIAALAVLAHVAGATGLRGVLQRSPRVAFLRATAWTAFILLFLTYGHSSEAAPFIYFQF